MKCTTCEYYNRGKGQRACLKCKQYLNIIKQSGKRHTIQIEILPDTILEAIPDETRIDLQRAIRMLPLDLSVPLSMYYVLSATQKDIAEYIGISQQQVSRKINIALEIIKEMRISD